MNNWQIHKATNLHTPCKWMLHGPDGSWMGAYATWDEAMFEVTAQVGDVAAELEHWLGEL